MRAPLRCLAALVLVLLLAAPASAETRGWWLGGVVGTGGANAQTVPAPADTATAAPDFEEWATFAARAEDEIAAIATTSPVLEALRSDLAVWREKFLAAQTANSPRIDTLKEQIAAIGAAPADGATEPEEITARRKELAEQLARAQAPGLAAEEAYRRADALIREADRLLRARDAHRLLRHDPAPANPANWGAGIAALSSFVGDLWAETSGAWGDMTRRDALTNAVPVVLLAALAALALIWQGRRWIGKLIRRLQDRLPMEWWGIVELPLSLGQVILPFAALVFLAGVLEQTEFLGPLSRAIIGQGMLSAGLAITTVLWIGWHVFPVDNRLSQVLVLPPERRAEGRVHVSLFAAALGAEQLLSPAFSVDAYGIGAQIVTFPATVLTGVLLMRIGQLLIQSARNEAEDGEGHGFRATVVALLGQAAVAVGVLGPLMGAIGYVGLASAAVRPAMVTLGLLALLAMLQRLTYDIYALITRADQQRAREALVPVLVSFVLALGILPLLALIWGMRSADLLEYWTRFREGFRVGETRFSPTDFVLFGVIFGAGYGLTKLLQAALRSTILPRTRIDTGGKNAIIAGTGYAGIVLAALAAINSTGLDLSSLAIVAGALSVGIGFGLQNIVQNFISGIILLIERPVAEGDWVEVGGVQGIVRGISIRSTRIETFDRTSVIVPNASLISGSVTNYTGFNMTGRLIVPVLVATDSDTRKVEQVLREIAEAQPMVVLNPPPAVPFVSIGAEGVRFEIRAILRDINFSGAVRTEMNHQIALRFAESGISFPTTYQEVRLLRAPAPDPERPLP